MPVTHPYITIDDVRMFIMDRSIEDNDLLLDLAYSDEEIQDAMTRAAREYNSVPPMCSFVDATCLDANYNMFLDGIAAQLFVSTISKLSRNDIDYDAGGAGVNIVAKRIKHLSELYKLHQQRFLEAAVSIKRTINLHQGFHSF